MSLSFDQASALLEAAGSPDDIKDIIINLDVQSSGSLKGRKVINYDNDSFAI